MINLFFSIKNPFSSPYSSVKNKDYVEENFSLSENKSLEIQISRFSEAFNLVDLKLDTNLTGRDHAGVELSLSILNYYFSINLYDHRHWDYDRNSWQIYDKSDLPIDTEVNSLYYDAEKFDGSAKQIQKNNIFFNEILPVNSKWLLIKDDFITSLKEGDWIVTSKKNGKIKVMTNEEYLDDLER